MTKTFDMAAFLSGALTGSYATRQRHLRQARITQAAVANRWQKDTPWCWKRKHLDWFLQHCLTQRSNSTKYYYLLTVRIITGRLEMPWFFSL